MIAMSQDRSPVVTVALGLWSALAGIGYLYAGVRILHRRRAWIVARYVQERREK